MLAIYIKNVYGTICFDHFLTMYIEFIYAILLAIYG